MQHIQELITPRLIENQKSSKEEHKGQRILKHAVFKTELAQQLLKKHEESKVGLTDFKDIFTRKHSESLMLKQRKTNSIIRNFSILRVRRDFIHYYKDLKLQVKSLRSFQYSKADFTDVELSDSKIRSSSKPSKRATPPKEQCARPEQESQNQRKSDKDQVN
mmetsp:Transcript_12813/g.21691  ORF Transcript_12813/g.21691 Transcript_12813/m.21691 type:complete len:162 (-) Transcript_12813:569-1054(-)